MSIDLQIRGCRTRTRTKDEFGPIHRSVLIAVDCAGYGRPFSIVYVC
jgi:hypothetical protein